MTTSVIDRLPDAVLLLDGGRALVRLNAAACELLDVEPGHVVGRPAGEGLDIRTPAGTPVLREAWIEPDGATELLFRRGDGADLAASVTVRVDADGGVLALRPSPALGGIATISAVSHELRSPPTSLRGYTSLMVTRWDTLQDSHKRTMVEEVRADGERVARLVEELLDCSRIEGARLALHDQLVDLVTLAHGVVERARAADPSIQCRVTFPDGFPLVVGDAGRLEQVLANLVENAARYGSPCGMRVRGSVVDGAALLEVSDRGPGIAQADLPRVFDCSFSAARGRGAGTGLGLWISRGIAQAHGGSLTVRSASGEGSTFVLALPAERCHEGSRSAAGPRS